jgi:hypothetical protein
MEVITKILKERGGQLRQFIVDDKGTVAIGTFGWVYSILTHDYINPTYQHKII